VTVLLLALTALGLEPKITWYLAVDQYGYLAFAHDLVRGQVFHHWPPLDALIPRLPARVDVLVQTYVYDHGRLYCRYAPGFPLLLAAWLRLFGDDGAHYLNPTIYLSLLVLVLAFQRRLFRSRWRATAGTALVGLFPSFLQLWALTVVRDLSTHLAGLLGLFLLLPARGRRLGRGRVAAAGLALGYAGSMRPDAVLYLMPALCLAAARWHREHARPRVVAAGLATGVLAVALGLTPLFAYDWLATGSPFRLTQGMEVEQFLATTPTPRPGSPQPLPAAPRRATPVPAAPAGKPPGAPRVGYPSGAWHGGTIFTVQGGGLRLGNLPLTLPVNIALLRHVYGDLLLGVALWGVLMALIQRPTLFLAAVPYTVPALLLFSCWPRSDPRYLSGVYLFVPMLVIEGMLGTLDFVRRLGRDGRLGEARTLALAVAGALLAGAALVHAPGGQTALPTLMVLLPIVCAAAALGAAAWPRRRVVAVAAPLLGLALVALSGWRTVASLDISAAFQRPEMLRARAVFGRAVEPGAVVITTEDVGRPAENIEYYSGGTHALYFTDLERWNISVPEAASRFARAGMVPYLLIPGTQRDRVRLLQDLGRLFSVELVADIPAAQAVEYFVAAPFHRGVPMELHRLVYKGRP